MKNNPLALSTSAIQFRPSRPVSGISTPTPLLPIATAPATKQMTVSSAHTAATVESQRPDDPCPGTAAPGWHI
jgi:hypothetical protein